jgi:hypothetical protein
MGFMKYVIEMCSGAIIEIYFINIGSAVQKVIRDIRRHIDIMRLLTFLRQGKMG